jgi:hypothetical protein
MNGKGEKRGSEIGIRRQGTMHVVAGEVGIRGRAGRRNRIDNR